MEKLQISLLAVLLLAATLYITPVLGEAYSLTEDKKEEINANKEKPEWKKQVENKTPERATLAGGCFWCIEAVYEDVEGIESAVSGYAGGKESTANYRQVATGETEHREAVGLKYYPSIISYEEILDKYWRSIDPTDPNGQFSDRGPQYTTAIYYHNQKQKKTAEESKENLSESGRFEEEIVTEIEEFTTFFRAEDRHQNYSKRKTAQYKTYERLSGRKGFVEKVWDKAN